jgi:hypothetical protein
LSIYFLRRHTSQKGDLPVNCPLVICIAHKIMLDGIPVPLGKAATASHHVESYVVGSNAAKLEAKADRICASVRGSFPAAARVTLTC